MNHHVELFVPVDHHRFTLQDECACWNGRWTNRTFQTDGVGVAPGVVSVVDATRSRGEAPVLVELLSAPPSDDDLGDYDGVVEAPLEAPSGRLRLVTLAEMFPLGTVAPGSYRVRVYYANADAAEPGGDAGADHYRIAIWPAPSRPIGLQVLKPRFDRWETKYYGRRSRAELTAWLNDTGWDTPAVSHRCLATVALLRLGDLGAVRRAEERETARAVQAVYTSAAWLAGEDAVDLLAGLTLSQSREIRRRAVQSLTRLRGPLAWRAISSLTEDPDSGVRDAAVAAQSERGTLISPGAA